MKFFKHPQGVFVKRCLIKYLLIMKLTFIFIFISCLQVSANGYSQTVTLNLKSVELKKALTAIEKNTSYRFLYSERKIANNEKVNINVTNAGISKVLEQLLAGTNLSYKELGNNLIVIIQKDEIVQDIRVKGRVTDKSNGQPLAGASIQIKGSKAGTTTDGNGSYALNVPNNTTLVVSSIGYDQVEVPVNGQTEINVTLQPSTTGLNEVVVVGYGTQKKAEITGSIATVDKKFLANRPITNSSQALQGTPGLYVNQGSGGQPGADAATIRIRGIGTLNNNDPLVLVDGIPYDLRDVNPNDIESISVLKDAAAAAIYGNRAANGVILVKTKSGRREKMSLEYDNYFGVQQPTYLPKTITNSYEFATLYNQALANVGKSPSFTNAQIDSFKVNQGKNSSVYSNTDWNKIIFKDAFLQQHNIRFSGGNDKALYSISLGYLNQDGIVIGTGAKRYSMATNLSFNVTDNLKVGINLNGSYWSKSQSPLGVSDLMQLTYRALPFQVATLPNGQYADQWFVLRGQGAFRNPYALAIEGSGRNNTTNILANFYAEYQLPFNLKYKINYGVTKEDDYTNNFVPNINQYNPITGASTHLDWLGTPRSAQRHNSNYLNTILYETLTWNKTIAQNHNINILLGNSVEDYTTSGFDAYVEGFINNQVTELSNGTINQAVTSSTAENKLLSYFGRGGYNYKEKYLAELNFRYDGSSRFAPERRWGFFPSASVGWRIDKENFFQNIRSTVSSFKLRASWGQLGNQNIANFAYQNTYANTVPVGYSFGSSIQVGAAGTSLSNTNISWEKTTTTDVGLDIGFFHEKLTLTADYFNRLTTGILTPVIIPSQVGNLSGPTENLYSMKNQGAELSVNYQNVLGKLEYHFGGNISYTKNKVVNLNGQQQISGRNIVKEGYSVNSFYVLKATGIFKTDKEVKDHAYEGPKTQPGDLIYQDINGDSVVDNNDRVVVGRSFPLYTYSFNFGVNYGGFDLSAFFQGVADVSTYPSLNLSQPFYNGAGIIQEWATGSWTPDRPNAKLPRLTTSGDYPQNSIASTFWMQDASYLRLKNLQIGYTLPGRVLKKIGVTKFRIFVNGQNILTFSKFKLVDPERVTTQSNIYSYPSVKMYTAGINLTF